MQPDSEEISLEELFKNLWARRSTIIGLTLAFGIGAAIFSLILPDRYESSVVLSPVDNETGGKLGGAAALVSQVGGLAGLAGIGLGGSGQSAMAVATLKSHALIEAFISDNNLLPILYPNEWDAAAKRWSVENPKQIPTLWKAERMFSRSILTINEDKKTGLITLTIEWTDPQLAARWATELVQRTNLVLRTKAINESELNLDYLNEQATKTRIVELQRSIYTLIEGEIKKIMIARGSDEFAFKIIDPARVAEERSSPKRSVIVAAGSFFGWIIGVVFATLLPKPKA